MKYILFNETGKLATRYDRDIHGNNIPQTAIEVDDELFWKTINEQDGVWILKNGNITKEPLPEPTVEELLQRAVAQNKEELSRLMLVANDAVVALQDMVDADLAKPSDEAKLKEWKAYRVALRNVNLENPTWPKAPK